MQSITNSYVTGYIYKIKYKKVFVKSD